MFTDTANFQADYLNGILVITCAATNECESITLNDDRGRNITLLQFKSGIKSHGMDKACQTFLRLAKYNKKRA